MMKVDEKQFKEFLEDLEIYLDPHKHKLDKDEYLELGAQLEKKVLNYKKLFEKPESKWKQLKINW